MDGQADVMRDGSIQGGSTGGPIGGPDEPTRDEIRDLATLMRAGADGGIIE